MESPYTPPFMRLPKDLLLELAKRLPDLASLHALASAAPDVFRLLDEDGGEILQAITSNRATTVPQVRDMIYIVVLVQTSAMPAWTLQGYLHFFVLPPILFRRPPRAPCVPPAPSKLPYSVLVMAKRVRDWSRACLAHHLEQMHDAQPRLRRPADPGFNYVHPPIGPDHQIVPPWQRQHVGVPYTTPAMGPASWVEEQVVVRALWRLQMVLDLQHAPLEGRLGGWRYRDRRQLSAMTIEDHFNLTSAAYQQLGQFEPQYQEVLTVVEYLQGQLGATNSRRLPALPDQILQEISRISEAVPEANGPNDAQTYYHPNSYLPQGLRLRPHDGMDFVAVFKHKRSPIRGISPRIFRRLGLAIWDAPRLASLGLMPRAEGISQYSDPIHASSYWFRLRSLLSPDELATVEETLMLAAEMEERLTALFPADDMGA